MISKGRGRFHPPRRLRFHRAGWIVSSGAVGLGVAAMTTGNNLLFLMLGAMLGLIALSGWLSELTLRGIEVERRVPRGVEAGAPARLAYEVRRVGRFVPSFAMEVGDHGDEARGFLASVAPSSSAVVRVERVWPRRGVYPLTAITVGTSFPFGLFRKERDLARPGEVVVRPRTDRTVREPRPAGDRQKRSGEVAAGVSGARGEYRSLRGYVPGDDPRDVHWRSTARTGEPVVREYSREQAQTLWLVLDLRADGRDESAGEAAVEIAATLAARAVAAGQPVALATADARIDPGTGAPQLERVLDALARARMRGDAPQPPTPVPPGECVLVTAGRPSAGSWGDVLTPEVLA